MARRANLPRRLLLLLTARTYRAAAFVEAAERLGIEVIKAISMHRHLAEYWNYPLGLQYDDPAGCVRSIVEFAAETPLGAIIAVDDSGSLVAAEASKALGLAHNSPESAAAARDKHIMRRMLRRAGVPSPESELFHFDESIDAERLADMAADIDYPCVIKPLNLNGSRGVMRVDSTEQFVNAASRLKRLLQAEQAGDTASAFLFERFIPGFEVAVEGMLLDGNLKILALFDKPDPLDGPFFEETIYVTPSRLPAKIQQSIFETTVEASAALGLREGPVHAELRINDAGPWIIELAGRSIGGLCSKTLRFGAGVSLEEMIVRQAFGMDVASLEREATARGVMMIPIPSAGLLKSIKGCETAASLSHIESVEITAQLNQRLMPLPEGDSYLGFIFAKGPSPEAVEAALRNAHAALSFEIAPELPLVQRDFEMAPG
ncbi:MAG: ATP-grasp domain-containing protein [Chloroflexota bacterium]|nr:MAG: ATP-grasp domain-containing protein [Chloroflexota bacterium]